MLGNPKARLWCQGRRNWPALVRQRVEACPHKGPSIWVHASSLGEFEQARPVIEALRARLPEARIWLTFFSPSGYEVRKLYAAASGVFYLPLDTPPNARKWVGLLQPQLALFAKYDLWPHLLAELARKQVPALLFSAHPRAHSAWFGRWGRWLYGPALRSLAHTYVQTEADAELFRKAGYTRVTAVGDTRFDRVWTVAQTASPQEWVTQWAGDAPVLVAGSTWPQDETLLWQALQAPELRAIRLLLVPHEVDAAHIQATLARVGGHAPRYTQLRENPGTDSRVLVVDAVGLLSGLYREAWVTYVGGGFGSGIHNTLEPSAHGKPVIFGPKHQRFREAGELMAAGAAVEVRSAEDLRNVLIRWLNEPQTCATAGEAAQAYVQANCGATTPIVEHSLRLVQ
jgi:3-deoxy-D-manno-octulosonic-acid transferase